MRTGIYTYSVMKWEPSGLPYFETHRMKVEIIAETPKRYRIRYMEPHATGRDPVNSLHLVRRDKVKTKDAEDKPAQQLELRLPYKDND